MIWTFSHSGKRGGFTLLELVLAVFILGMVAAIVTVRLGDALERARVRVAERDLVALREAFVGSATLPGYLADMRTLPGFSPVHLRVHNLLNPTNVSIRTDSGLLHPGDDWPFGWREGAPAAPVAAYAAFTNWNPETGRGWRGPYIRGGQTVRNTVAARSGLFPAPDDGRAPSDMTFRERGFYPDASRLYESVYGFSGEQAMGDPWGNPYVLQIPPAEAFESPTEELRFRYARLVSAGPDGILQTPCLNGMDYLAFIDNPPPDPGATPPPAPLWKALDGASVADYRRALRLAGRVASGDMINRGDDIVIFLNRADTYARDE